MTRRVSNIKDTIFALTTGSLPSGVAIVKISGINAFSIAEKLFVPFSKKTGLSFGSIKNLNGDLVDRGLLLSFFSPNSHTGEDVVEFHLHGSKAIVSSVEYSIESLGARRANPGEFSYRSFINGKTTIDDLENLGDVFSVSDGESLNRIYARRDGSLEKKIVGLRKRLIDLQAILDTAVDFSDEYSTVVSSANIPLEMIIHEINELVARYSSLKISPDLPRLVIAGCPNAGKSSLFNAILCRYRAIVHSDPGTTRDVIEEEISLAGKSWKLVDTAGIRETDNQSEKKGIEIAEDYLSGAAYWLLVVDGRVGMTKNDFNLIEKFGSIPHRLVWNKLDLSGWNFPEEYWKYQSANKVSAATGEGISELIQSVAENTLINDSNRVLPTPTRLQAIKLESVLKELKSLSDALIRNEPPEYLSEINRQSIQTLESVFGEVSVDDVLDRVFSEFCIGK